MNGKGAMLAAVVALLTALAANGEKAFAAIGGLPKVLQAFSQGLPFGLASFLAAFALATVVWWTADRRLHFGAGGSHGRDFRADNLSLVVGLAVTVVQTLVVRDTTAATLLQAIMLGILAGLLAPFAGRLGTALWKRWVA